MSAWGRQVEIIRYPVYRGAEAIVDGEAGDIPEGFELGHVGEPAFRVADAVRAGEGERWVDVEDPAEAFREGTDSERFGAADVVDFAGEGGAVESEQEGVSDIGDGVEIADLRTVAEHGEFRGIGEEFADEVVDDLLALAGPEDGEQAE